MGTPRGRDDHCPCPQIPTYFPRALQAPIAWLIRDLTAGSRSSNVAATRLNRDPDPELAESGRWIGWRTHRNDQGLRSENYAIVEVLKAAGTVFSSPTQGLCFRVCKITVDISSTDLVEELITGRRWLRYIASAWRSS